MKKSLHHQAEEVPGFIEVPLLTLSYFASIMEFAILHTLVFLVHDSTLLHENGSEDLPHHQLLGLNTSEHEC